MVVTNGLPRSGARRSVAQQSEEAPRPWAGGPEILARVDRHHPAAGPDAAGPGRVLVHVDGAWCSLLVSRWPPAAGPCGVGRLSDPRSQRGCGPGAPVSPTAQRSWPELRPRGGPAPPDAPPSCPDTSALRSARNVFRKRNTSLVSSCNLHSQMVTTVQPNSRNLALLQASLFTLRSSFGSQ